MALWQRQLNPNPQEWEQFPLSVSNLLEREHQHRLRHPHDPCAVRCSTFRVRFDSSDVFEIDLRSFVERNLRSRLERRYRGVES